MTFREYDTLLPALTADLERRKRLARDVFASMDGVTAATLRTLSVGLSFADEPLRELSRPIDYWADVVEDPERIEGTLAVLGMSVALKRVTFHPDCADLVARLECQPGQLWQALAGALTAVQEGTG